MFTMSKNKRIVLKSNFTRLGLEEDLETQVLLLECVGEKEEKELETWFSQSSLLE